MTTVRPTATWTHQPWAAWRAEGEDDMAGWVGAAAGGAGEPQVALHALGLRVVHALGDGVADADTAVGLLAALPLDTRLCWAAVSRRWRDALRHPSLWARVSFARVRPAAAAAATDEALAALCVRAGAGLRALDVRGARGVTAEGVAEALVACAPAAAALEELLLSHTLPEHRLSLPVAQALHAACPALRAGAFVLAPECTEDVAPALTQLPPLFARTLRMRCIRSFKRCRYHYYLRLESAEHVSALAGALRRGAVASLDLRMNRFDADAVAHLAAALAHSASLTTLRLGAAALGDAGAAALAEVLQAHGTLRTLDLRDNDIGNAGAAALGGALAANGALRALHLGGNAFDAAGVGALAGALAVNSTLTTLRLGAGHFDAAAAAPALALALRGNTSLRTLALDNGNLDDAGAAALAEALCDGAAALTSLDLHANAIGDAGAAALAHALACDDSALAELILDGRRYNGHAFIGDAGAAALAAALAHNTALTRLSLRDQHVGAAGAAALAAALTSCAREGARSALLCLDLSGNEQLGDAGAGAFAAALAAGAGGGLLTLRLAGSGAGDGAAAALAAALLRHAEFTRAAGASRCSSLRVLDLSDTRIGPDGAAALAAVVRARSGGVGAASQALRVELRGTPAAAAAREAAAAADNEADDDQADDEARHAAPQPAWASCLQLFGHSSGGERADEDDTSDDWA
jgi:hypothetical protein